MQINMYAVRVCCVRDAKGPLERHLPCVVITIARDHKEALQRAHERFANMTAGGVVVEYGDPSQLSDTVALESLVYA